MVPSSARARLAFLLVLASVSSASSDELGPHGSESRGLVVHDAATVLRDRCARDDLGRLWFTLPGGTTFELITSTTDPQIINPGDGSFHAFDSTEVRAALAELRYPLDGIDAEVYILPFPRRNQLTSAAGPGLVLLSPGVRPLTREHQHAEVVHEIGHIVQYALMPDRETARWDAYRRLRGILDLALYSPEARHENRPHEIFAEDFRALFGGASAVASGSIENASLVHPGYVSGLREFLLELAGIEGGVGAVQAAPNPARGRVRFFEPFGEPVPLDVFDVSGRRVATCRPALTAGGVAWTHDLVAANAGGRNAVLFARPRRAGARSVKLVTLP